MSSFLKRKNLIKSGIGILIRNPKLIINLLNFDKAYCSYFQSKLKYAKKFYEENKFGRNMYVFSLKHKASTYTQRMIFRIKKTKFGNNVFKWFS